MEWETPRNTECQTSSIRTAGTYGSDDYYHSNLFTNGKLQERACCRKMVLGKGRPYPIFQQDLMTDTGMQE